MQLLAIDLGTSSVKVLLTTETGQILGQSSSEYPIQHPQPDQAEQSPEEWWQATVAAVQQVLAEAAAGRQQQVAAIGLSGQMHGTVLLDNAGQLLAPAIIWPDQRSRRQVQEITELLGVERLLEVSGSPVATGFQAATIRWIQQERPQLWQRVDQILLPKDYLRFQLTDGYQTDPSDASGTPLLDTRRRDWSTEILKALQIEPEQLPPVQPADSVAGQLSSRAARALGLPPGIPVITGAADTACGALGAGIIDSQSLLLTLSTGGQILLPTPEVTVDSAGRSHTFCSALAPGPNRPGWYQLAAILSAGMALRWLRDQLFGLTEPDAYAKMISWAAGVPPGANGLLFLPYLTGERTPHMDPQARGMFLGLSAGHGRAELVRAVLEGVALACYDAFTILAALGATPARIVMAGGGAGSSLWRQIVADVFNLPVQQLEVKAQSAMGAILLAGSGIGLFRPEMAAQKWSSYGPPLEPQAHNHERYQELLSIFRAAYQQHREDFRALQAIAERERPP